MLLLRSIFFTLLLPGMVTVLIPALLIISGRLMPFPQYGVSRLLGLPLMMVGGGSLLWCIWEFYTTGKGTLAALDPPKKLVVSGLYQYVRNPMYVAVITTLLGETIYFGSAAILLEAGLFAIIVNVYIACYEEPTLRKQFGEEYEKYTQKVRRWMPCFRSPDP